MEYSFLQSENANSQFHDLLPNESSPITSSPIHRLGKLALGERSHAQTNLTSLGELVLGELDCMGEID